MPEVVPFPWDRLGSATSDESVVAAWAAARAWPGDGVLGGLAHRATVRLDPERARARAGEASAAAVAVRRGALTALVIVPWRSWRAIAAAVLGGDDELAAPRPPTPVERAFAVVAVADAIERAGVEATVEAVGDGAAALAAGPALAVSVAVSRPVAAELTVLVAAPVPWPPPVELAALVAARGARLPVVAVELELARGALAAGALAGIAIGDVVVVGARAPAVRIARGRIAVALDEAAGRITVGGTYQRVPPMTRSSSPSAGPADQLADDLRVPLAVVIADVDLPARALLELVPGQVVALGRPVGSAVELRSGDRCLARGELVVVDGELGVRVAALAEEPVAGPLVDGGGAVVVPAPR